MQVDWSVSQTRQETFDWKISLLFILMAFPKAVNSSKFTVFDLKLPPDSATYSLKLLLDRNFYASLEFTVHKNKHNYMRYTKERLILVPTITIIQCKMCSIAITSALYPAIRNYSV